MKRVLAALMILMAGSAQAAPQRIVSLDYCADQYVLGLADRAQIAALSADAERPFSYLRDDARGLPKARADAESILALKPDLVVRAWGGDALLMKRLNASGIATHDIGYAASIADAIRLTKDAGIAFGQSARAETLIASMPPPQAPTGTAALYLTPGGVTAGADTLIGDIMTHAGFTNAEARAGWANYSLEDLVRNPPRVVLTAFFGFDTDARDAWSPARHPVLGKLLADAKTVRVNEARVSCAAWFAADEAEALAHQIKAKQ